MIKNFKRVKALLMCISMSFVMVLGVSNTSYAEQVNKVANQERFKCRASVSMIIEREYNGEHQVLLQLRQNTGLMDNTWDFGACGHLDEGETLRHAAIRESKEELNIDVDENDMDFVYLGSNFMRDKSIYCCTYFKVNKFSGDLRVNEPDKCKEIRWFSVDNLPDNMMPMQRFALQNYLKGIHYGEFGWQDYVK